LADPTTAQGLALRERLFETTGLSRAGIEQALSSCLETSATSDELDALLGSVPRAPAAHVLLSGNVFVAALRAIAIGVACSERVFVRASRRDPALAQALHALEPQSFELVTALDPQAGDHFWAYGSNETLTSLRAQLPSGVWLHGHGHGLGAVVLEPRPDFRLSHAVELIARDTALFDQRGCLSPRLVCVVGNAGVADEVASALAESLARLEVALPLGPRSPEQLAEARRKRDAAAYAFELKSAGSGWLSVGSPPMLPPTERCLHIAAAADAVAILEPFARHLTCIGADVSPTLADALRHGFAAARICPLGRMQRPPFDGPVDRRGSPELL
jgi:hypothetical protein